MESKLSSITKICRLCLKKGYFCKNVLLKIHKNTFKLIQTFLGIQIRTKDELHCICPDCDKKLEEWDRFFIEVHEVQKKLAQGFSLDEPETKTEIKEQPWEDPFGICETSHVRSPMINREGSSIISGYSVSEQNITQEKKSRCKNLTKIYICQKCGKTLASKTSLMDHMRLHISPEEKEKLKLLCDLCKKVFTSKMGLYVHMRMQHLPPEDTISCDKCPKTFTNHFTFKSHYKAHFIDRNEAKVACPDCGMQVRASRLNPHKKLKHVHSPQICDFCKKSFQNKILLKNHQRIVHVEPKFNCDLCDKKFKMKDKFNDHRMKHFITNRFSCDQCDFTNNDYANMLKHRKTIHSDAPALVPGTGRKILSM